MLLPNGSTSRLESPVPASRNALDSVDSVYFSAAAFREIGKLERPPGTDILWKLIADAKKARVHLGRHRARVGPSANIGRPVDRACFPFSHVFADGKAVPHRENAIHDDRNASGWRVLGEPTPPMRTAEERNANLLERNSTLAQA
jgi:hypothetical protein